MEVLMIRPLKAGAVLTSLLALAACGGASSPSTPAGGGGGGTTTNADVVITINGINGGMSFSPAAATMRVGQTVAWRNADALTHDVLADSGTFDTLLISAGRTSTPITMTTAGTIPYHCSIHPAMVATLTVQ
jgi:plastocyanin